MILINDCIATDGYLSKAQALIKDTQSTADKVAHAMKYEVSKEQVDKFKQWSIDMLDWLIDVDQSGTDEFITKIRENVVNFESKPSYGLFACLPTSYNKFVKFNLDVVAKASQPTSVYPLDVGAKFFYFVEIVSIDSKVEYDTIYSITDDGYIIVFHSSEKGKFALGRICITGTVNKFIETTCCRMTALSRVKQYQ